MIKSDSYFYIGNCVNSFDNSGDCIIPQLPYNDASDFAVHEEKYIQLPIKQKTFNTINANNGFPITDSYEDLEFFYDQKKDLLVVYSEVKDIHYFFAKKNKNVLNYIREALEFNNNKEYIPSDDVKRFAQSVIQKMNSTPMSSEKDNEGSGRRKIQDLASGTPQTHAQLNRLLSFFRTNESAYQQEISSGKDFSSSQIIQRWELHGGNPAFQWAQQELSSNKQSNLHSKETARKMGGAGERKGMGALNKDMMSVTNYRTAKPK